MRIPNKISKFDAEPMKKNAPTASNGAIGHTK